MDIQQHSRTFLGVAVIAIGVGFLMDSLNIIDFSRIAADGWPVLIVLVGLLSLLSNPRAWLWPLLIMASGGLLLLRELGALEFNVWQLIWPAIVITVGASLIMDRFGDEAKRKSAKDRDNLFVAFSGNNTSNISDDYQGGKLTAIFGGIELDLRKAAIKHKGTATIDAFTACGGISLRVPETWSVQANGLPIMGGWDNKAAKPKDKDAPTLIIRSTCIMGGIEIKN